MKRVIGNTVLVLVSLLVGLLLCEVAARLLLNPADYLSVRTITDDVLGIRIEPGAPGFDELGCRNSSVPSRADVVAVGDSHTYGNNATMTEAWPAVVGNLTGQQVYNLGLGGYGPNQYYELLQRHIARLKPKWVVCAIYMGDDFENAFLMTYGRDYWKPLRRGTWGQADADIWRTDETSSWHRLIRVWLSRTSIIYRLVVHGPLVSRLKQAVQLERAAQSVDPAVLSLRLEEAGINEAFRPLSLRSRLDQNSPLVREGMRITFELIQRMNALSQQHGARFAVVVIPTKETVFAEYLLKQPDGNLRDAVDLLVRDEKAATGELLAFLDNAAIPHVEAQSALSRQVSKRLYTFSDQDMHPNQNGYRVIGETVAGFLRAQTARR
jgi:hypothetical protein